jgi:glycosyltransferase involved in cell wall biosynthesis
VIPVFNRVERIEAAVRSVQDQRPDPPDRIIVVDDGSTDGSAELVRSLGVELIVHEHNKGVCAARNTGLHAAHTTWVAWLDSDDTWLPDHLANLAPITGDHVFVADSSVAISPVGRRWIGPPTPGRTVLDSPTQLLFPDNFISTSSLVVRREVALGLGGYRDENARIEDLDLLVRLLERGTGLVVPDVGTIYDEHGGDQLSADLVQMRRLHLELIASYQDRPWWTPKLLRSFDAACAWDDARLAQRESRSGDALRALGRVARDPRKALAVVEVVRTRREQRRRLGAAPSLPGA